MSDEVTFICYLVAFLSFLVVASGWTRGKLVSLTFLGIGLAAWVLVPLWAAGEAAF